MKQMIILANVFLLMCVAGAALAQGTLDPPWVVRKASPLENGNAEAWGIDADAHGNLYWATNQDRPGFLQGLDIVLFKLDSLGNALWPAPAVYAGKYAQQVYKVTATDSIVYLAGRNCTQFTLDPDLPFCDMLVLAVNAATGDTLWATTWDRGFGYEEGDGLAVEADGIYVTGWSVGDNTDTDIGLLKLDFDGAIVWSNAWGTANRDHQDGHSVVDDSVIYAAGLYSGPSNPGGCLIKDYNGKALLAKFSRVNGAYLEHITFGRTDPWCNFENALGMATDGHDLYVTGVTSIASDDLQIFLMKFDKNLHLIWETAWGGSDAESARAIELDAGGNIYIGANTKSFGAGGLDVALLKFSPEGQLRWFKTWGGGQDDQVLDIAVEADAIYVTGKTQSFHPKGKNEAFLLKVKSDVATAVSEVRAPVSGYSLGQNYPNPFNSSTAIRFVLPEANTVALSVYTVLGRKIATLVDGPMPAGEHRVVFDAHGLTSGVYVVKLEAGSVSAVRKALFLK